MVVPYMANLYIIALCIVLCIVMQYQLLNEPAISFAQGLSTKPVYSMKEAIALAGSSRRTVYRHIQALRALGVIKSNRGRFIINTSVVSQPTAILKKLVPSLTALNKARRFGRTYNQSDINFAIHNIPDKIITLDYRAWDLAKFQYPQDLYLYVNKINEVADYLKDNGFSEGQKGRVVLLPKIGDFTNEIERVYQDSMAKGGRSMLDAIAIELLYGNQLKSKGRFTIQDIMKVQEDLQAKRLDESTNTRSH